MTSESNAGNTWHHLASVKLVRGTKSRINHHWSLIDINQSNCGFYFEEVGPTAKANLSGQIHPRYSSYWTERSRVRQKSRAFSAQALAHGRRVIRNTKSDAPPLRCRCSRAAWEIITSTSWMIWMANAKGHPALFHDLSRIILDHISHFSYLDLFRLFKCCHVVLCNSTGSFCVCVCVPVWFCTCV